MISTLFNVFLYFTVGALALMAIFDLVFYIVGGTGKTLSYKFWVLCKTWPVVPWAFGVLCGHLVWQYNPDMHAVAHGQLTTAQIVALVTAILHVVSAWLNRKKVSQ